MGISGAIYGRYEMKVWSPPTSLPLFPALFTSPHCYMQRWGVGDSSPEKMALHSEICLNVEATR